MNNEIKLLQEKIYVFRETLPKVFNSFVCENSKDEFFISESYDSSFTVEDFVKYDDGYAEYLQTIVSIIHDLTYTYKQETINFKKLLNTPVCITSFLRLSFEGTLFIKKNYSITFNTHIVQFFESGNDLVDYYWDFLNKDNKEMVVKQASKLFNLLEVYV